MKKKMIVKNEVVEMSYEEVLELFTPAIHREINRQKAIFDRPEEEREDMFQEACYMVWKGFENHDINSNYHFSTYILQYIKLGVQQITVKNNTQKRDGETVSMEKTIGSSDEDFSLSDILSENPDMDSPIIAREVLTEAIKSMSDVETEYLLFMLNDYTEAETGRERGVSRAAAQQKYKKIKEKIRIVATKYGYQS